MIRRFRQREIRHAFLLLKVNFIVSISEVNGEEKKFRYNIKNTPKIKTSKCKKVFMAKEIFSRVDFGKKECRNHKDENKNFGGKISHLWQDNLMKIPVFPRVYAHARSCIKDKHTSGSQRQKIYIKMLNLKKSKKTRFHSENRMLKL